MQSPFDRWALIVAGLIFVGFLLLKLRAPARMGRAERRDLRQRLSEIKRKARDAATPELRAAAWREAARIALEELGRPSLAGSYAHRAERADPKDEAAVGLLAHALRRASRLAALERFLWRRLANGKESQGGAYNRALQELVALYQGPLRRRDRARALRQLAPQVFAAESAKRN